MNDKDFFSYLHMLLATQKQVIELSLLDHEDPEEKKKLNYQCLRHMYAYNSALSCVRQLIAPSILSCPVPLTQDDLDDVLAGVSKLYFLNPAKTVAW